MSESSVPWVKIVEGMVAVLFEGNAIEKRFYPQDALTLARLLEATANAALKEVGK